MAPIPSIDELRSWLSRDQAALDAMSERLKELEDMSQEELSASARNTLSTWDRSTIKECNKHLQAMENIENPSKEERSIMSELHKLVSLGDHMLERINAMQATIRHKTLKSKKPRQGSSSSKPVKEQEEDLPSHKPVQKQAEHKTSAPEHFSVAKDVPEPPRSPTPAAKVVETSDPSDSQPADNKLIYDLLGVSHNASIAEIKKAIRKQTMQRHPDRLPGDADASTKFADFKILCAVLEKEDSRQEYDQTGEVEDVDDLAGLVARLKL